MATWVPGAQRPEKYPKVGPKYKRWGEMQHSGLSYDPNTDTYFADPKAQAQLEAEIQQSLAPEQPKQPGLWESTAAATVPSVASLGGLLLLQNALNPSVTAAAGSAAAGGVGAAPASLIGPGLNTATDAQLLQAANYFPAAPLNPAAAGAGMLPGDSFVVGQATPTAQGGLLGLQAPTLPSGIAGVAVPAAVAAQTLLSGKTAYDMLQGDVKPIHKMGLSDLKDDPGGLIGRAGLAIATGGLSEIANLGFGRKSTKDYQRERWGALSDQGINVAGYDPSKQAGYEAAGFKDWGSGLNAAMARGEVKPEEVWGGLGMYETFGNEWLQKAKEDQRRAISQKLLDEQLLTSDKGDVLVRDKDRAREIFKEIVGE
jgi:hypothetical protein